MRNRAFLYPYRHCWRSS